MEIFLRIKNIYHTLKVWYISNINFHCLHFLHFLAVHLLEIFLIYLMITSHLNTSRGNDLTIYAAINTPIAPDKPSNNDAFLG